MSQKSQGLGVAQQEVHSCDILAGIASADRDQLAAYLALFENSTLAKHLEQLWGKANHWLLNRLESEVQTATTSVQMEVAFWQNSAFQDNDLRLILLIHLREAFELPARLSISMRGAKAIATELTAAAIHATDPPGLAREGKNLLRRWGWAEEDSRCTTFTDIVVPVLQELLHSALDSGAGQIGAVAQEELLNETRQRLKKLSKADQGKLLEQIGAKELNDTAIRNLLLTGGGLAAANLSVGAAGFSAYILAAKASAFIPLVSGPALVSFVAVLANPVTTIGGTAAAVWWATSSAKRKTQIEVGLRVLALLALQSLSGGCKNWGPAVLDSLSRVNNLAPIGRLSDAILKPYREEWRMLEPAVGNTGPIPNRTLLAHLDRPVLDTTESQRLAELLFCAKGESAFNASIATLTLGDIVYSAAAIDPMVIKAADFARVEDLGDPLAFADFANKLLALRPASMQGAINNLKGYVAEQVVAEELVAQGHQVEFPAESTQEGWDLIVDGVKFQVKCLADISGLGTHFNKYEFPVLANSELADQIPPEWTDRVFFVEGYSEELVTHITEHALEAGEGVFDPAVPEFVLGAKAARSFMSYRAGKVSGVQAIEQLLLDGSARAGLAAIGGYVGSSIGLLVFGPAGAMVLGAALPVLSQVKANAVTGILDKHVMMDEWQDKMEISLNSLYTCLNCQIDKKLQLLRLKYKKLGTGQLSLYTRQRFVDEARFLREAKERLRKLTQADNVHSIEQRAGDVIRWAANSTIHPALYQAEIKQLSATIGQRPSLTERLQGPADEVFDKVMDVAGKTKEFAFIFFDKKNLRN